MKLTLVKTTVETIQVEVDAVGGVDLTGVIVSDNTPLPSGVTARLLDVRVTQKALSDDNPLINLLPICPPDDPPVGNGPMH